MTRHPDPDIPAPSAPPPARWASDRLINIDHIRTLFKLGRTAAYELTHRPDFPEPILISPRCYRWWASEVDAFADSLHRKRAERSAAARRAQRPANRSASHPASQPRRITGKVRAARARREAP